MGIKKQMATRRFEQNRPLLRYTPPQLCDVEHAKLDIEPAGGVMCIYPKGRHKELCAAREKMWRKALTYCGPLTSREAVEAVAILALTGPAAVVMIAFALWKAMEALS